VIPWNKVRDLAIPVLAVSAAVAFPFALALVIIATS
jgi:hypothetical protein